VPRPSPNFGGLQTPPSGSPGGPSNGGDGGNLPNTCFKRSNAWPIEMCDGTVCNGAEGECWPVQPLVSFTHK
jgi:hypothetical protein